MEDIVKRTTETLKCDVAAQIKRSTDLRNESAELHRTADAVAQKAVRLKAISKRKRR